MSVENFERYEIKYIISKEQKEMLDKILKFYMILDEYGKSTICNLYYDSDDYRLISKSLEKPSYKEKLRVRSYGNYNTNQEVFIELKKKYKGVVYKRRVTMTEKEAKRFLLGEKTISQKTQVEKEILYFLKFYEKLEPKMYIAYEREALYDKENHDFRITFDSNIRWRRDRLSLKESTDGKILLPNAYLLEVKTSAALPLWLAKFLSENKIFKTSFSKYGKAYETMMEEGSQRKEKEGVRKYG